MSRPLGATTAAAARTPTYIEIGQAFRVLDGERARDVRELMNAIFELANSPQSPIVWSDPDHWIGERLAGDAQQLARKIWDRSGKSLNPRYLYASHKIINRLKLLDLVGGAYMRRARGERFLAGDQAILRELMALRVSRRRAPDPSSPTDASAEE
jgi:restriction system protein